jgi:hypothetical protein
MCGFVVVDSTDGSLQAPPCDGSASGGPDGPLPPSPRLSRPVLASPAPSASGPPPSPPGEAFPRRKAAAALSAQRPRRPTGERPSLAPGPRLLATRTPPSPASVPPWAPALAERGPATEKRRSSLSREGSGAARALSHARASPFAPHPFRPPPTPKGLVSPTGAGADQG